MSNLNKNSTKLLKHLAAGKAVLTNEGVVVYLTGVLLDANPNSNHEDSIEYALSDLDNMELFVSPEQAYIDKLEAQVKIMEEEIKRLNMPKKTAKYNHLKGAEVREIELMFESGKTIDVKLIESSYTTSQPVISRIRTGKHPKTSEAYKTYLLKQAYSDDAK